MVQVERERELLYTGGSVGVDYCVHPFGRSQAPVEEVVDFVFAGDRYVYRLIQVGIVSEDEIRGVSPHLRPSCRNEACGCSFLQRKGRQDRRDDIIGQLAYIINSTANPSALSKTTKEFQYEYTNQRSECFFNITENVKLLVRIVKTEIRIEDSPWV